MKRILLSVPYSKYIDNDVFMSIYNTIMPGHVLDFQYFYGYSRAQIMNLILDFTRKNGYDYVVILDRPFSNDLLYDIIDNGDLVYHKDSGMLILNKNILSMLGYPEFETCDTKLEEYQKLMDKIKMMGEVYEC